MKTDDLIAILSTQLEPVDTRSVSRGIVVAIGLGALAAAVLVFVGFGVRSDVGDLEAFVYLAAKLVFTLAVVTLAAVYLTRLARPGGERRMSFAIIALPFIGIMGLAVAALSFAPRSHWHAAVLGNEWVECLVSIPVIAVVPFALTIWAVRRAMPTDLRRTGALAGLVAGGLSAMGYSLHCMDDSVPFVALWYGGTIALCTVAGALLGPRLLRW
ncbi:NrsF family protein [Rhodoplanes azumiensis]|uniref:NrsF family protein n=1 Tax=Rhodoplanes azumiensis TaxID=1897628 RepID=A0ABW5AFN6_9BRAD